MNYKPKTHALSAFKGLGVERWIWAFALVLASLWVLPSASQAPFAKVLTVHDAIGPASADYVVRAIGKAEAEGASMVVLELDTPGGLDTSMRQIIQAVLVSKVPVVTYVSPQGARAASAGTFILYASHVAAMAPATTLGAATPVAIGMPSPPKPKPAEEAPTRADKPPAAPQPAAAPADAMAAKQVNDAAAFIRGLAHQHGRNAEWAERAVREAVSLTAAEALEQKVVDLVASDLTDLMSQLDGRVVQLAGGPYTLNTKGLAIRTQPPDWRHRLLSVIANPSLALVLLMVGIYGLIFEFSSPGFGLPGTVGAICLLLALFALQMLPVNYAALALILLGFALLAAELLTPAFGVLGVGGVIAFVVGGLLLFDSDVPGMGVPLPLLLGIALTSAAVVLVSGSMALRARRARVVSGREAMVGSTGQVTSVQGDQIWALVHGERWQVRASSPLAVGQAIKVLAMDGLVLEVMPLPAVEPPSSS
jgi:membrane-bound serine protease (ClpP class)